MADWFAQVPQSLGMPSVGVATMDFRYPALVLVTMLFPRTPAQAQCCLGAQDVIATARNGMVRVEAISLTEKGPSHHGPYRYSLRWSEKIGAAFHETHRFEVRYDTREHFSMDIYISPAGNGFLLDASISPKIVFHDPTGRVIRRWKRTELMVGWYDPLDETGHFLMLWDPEPVKSLRGQSGLNYARNGELFLPASERVGPELEARLLTLVVPPPRSSEGLEADIGHLRHRDVAVRERAAERLRAAGAAAVDLLERFARDEDVDGREVARGLLDELVIRQCGVERPWRDVGFLSALLLYPSARVARAATARLSAILSDEVLHECPSRNLRGTAEWFQEHLRQIVWSPEHMRYLWESPR